MKFNFIMLGLVLVFGISCASQSGQRDPASVEKEKESGHQKFQGVFDKQY